MATWESSKYELTFSTLGGDLLSPAPYRFRLERTLVTGDTYFYRVAPDPENPPGANPFAGCVLLPQKGRRLTHYLPPAQRLDPNGANYLAKLELLIDEIAGGKIENDPDGYERLVGYIPVDQEPVNPVTFYKVEHTHKHGKVLLVVQLQLRNQAPGGSIGVIAR